MQRTPNARHAFSTSDILQSDEGLERIFSRISIIRKPCSLQSRLRQIGPEQLEESRFETDRYLNAASADINDVRPSLRAQYVNLNDDQDYSPFVSYTSEVDFDSASPYREQNLNLGVDKVFNFDSGFIRLPPSSDSSTRAAWSFGISAVAQRRFTDPAPGSYALAVTPSAAYVVSDQWNISISAPITTRWYDAVGRLRRRSLALEPTGIVEYIIPTGWLGGDKIANRLGNPAIDFVVGETRQWSNASGGAYVQMTAGVALKTGWRF